MSGKYVMAVAAAFLMLSVGAAQAAHRAHHGKYTPPDDAGAQQEEMSGCKDMMRGHGEKMRGHHKKHRAMMGQGQSPAVVINIFSDGGMNMPGGAMGHGKAMMRHHGAKHGKGKMSGHGMMGHGGAWSGGDMTVDDARAMLETHARQMGNGELSVGVVTVIDDDLIDAELLGADGAPVQRIIVNRHTGAMMRVS